MTTTIWVLVWFAAGLGAPPSLVQTKDQLRCNEMLVDTHSRFPGDQLFCAPLELVQPLRKNP